MEYSFPENAVQLNGKYDRVFYAEDWTRTIEKFFQTGVHPVPEDGLHVSAEGDSMIVDIGIGAAFIRGHTYINDASLPIEIHTANPDYARRDIIVIRQSNTQRTSRAIYRVGTPANVPEPPALIRDDDEYEIQLAEILVKAGTQTITQADITDTRANTAVCGLSFIPLYHTDLSTFYDQYNTRKELEFAAMDAHLATYEQWWKNYTNTSETTWATFQALWRARMTGFDDWFGTIRGNIFDEKYFDLENWAYRAGETYHITVGDDGSVKKTLTSKADGHLIAETLTVVDTDGSVITTLTNNDLNISTRKITRVNDDGSIDTEMEDHTNVYG